MSNEDEDEITIVWGQDLEHCAGHCYEDLGVDRWRCLARDHVDHESCSEDFLHCKIDFKLIDNPSGTNNYCEDHQEYNKS